MKKEDNRNMGSSQNPFGQTLGGSDFSSPKRSLPPDALRLYHGIQRFLNGPSPSGPTLSSYRAATRSSDTVNQTLSRELTRQASQGLSHVIDHDAFSDKTTPAVSNSTTSPVIRGTETFSPQRKASSGTGQATFKPDSAGRARFSVADPRHTDAIQYGSDTTAGTSSRLRSQGDTPDYAPAADNEGFHLPDEIHPGLISSDSPGQQERTRQETVRIQYSLGNEGFTLSPDTFEQAARFRAAMEDTENRREPFCPETKGKRALPMACRRKAKAPKAHGEPM